MNYVKTSRKKGTKQCVIKRKLSLQDYKNCLKASQIINTVNYLKKNEIDVDYSKEDKKDFIKNRLILKTQQRFKSERLNVFTEEINKIDLS